MMDEELALTVEKLRECLAEDDPAAILLRLPKDGREKAIRLRYRKGRLEMNTDDWNNS
jgi:hypothetical protein